MGYLSSPLTPRLADRLERLTGFDGLAVCGLCRWRAARRVAVISGAAVGVAGIAVGWIALIEFGGVGAQVCQFAGHHTVALKRIDGQFDLHFLADLGKAYVFIFDVDVGI